MLLNWIKFYTQNQFFFIDETFFSSIKVAIKIIFTLRGMVDLKLLLLILHLNSGSPKKPKKLLTDSFRFSNSCYSKTTISIRFIKVSISKFVLLRESFRKIIDFRPCRGMLMQQNRQKTILGFHASIFSSRMFSILWNNLLPERSPLHLRLLLCFSWFLYWNKSLIR